MLEVVYNRLLIWYAFDGVGRMTVFYISMLLEYCVQELYNH